MASVNKTEQIVSAELEAHHRLCLEVSALQTELNCLKNGSWKKLKQLNPDAAKVEDSMANATAGPLKKLRLCACGCGERRQCSGKEQEGLQPLPCDFFKAPPGGDRAAQRAYHDKLAVPRKIKEEGDDEGSRQGSKRLIDPSYFEQLAVPREKARERNMQRRSGPVPKLPDLRGLQAKVIAANERAEKPQKPPPFISCPAKPAHSFSAPDLQLGHKREAGALPVQSSIMPRPQRRLTASKSRGIDEDLPGLGELRARHLTGHAPLSLHPPTHGGINSPSSRKPPRKIIRSLDAQQHYIDRFLTTAPKPKDKQELLMMKLEALRNERFAREEGRLPSRQETQITSTEVQMHDEEEPVMPAVNWDELL